MPNRRLPLLAAALLVAACSRTSASPASTGGSPGTASASPSSAPSPAIDHLIGATDLVLRLDQGGGLIAPQAIVTNGPIFSLYGDGTIIFRNVTETPPTTNDGIGRGLPYRTARLSEPQIQKLLGEAINEGALGIARAQYDSGRVMDAPTTTFTLITGGVTKTVSVVALGIEEQPGPDALLLTALAKLRDRLQQFDAGTGSQTQPYLPERYRAVLMESFGGGPAPIAWPWATIKPAEFVLPAEAPGAFFPRRTITPADAAKLGLEHIEGGILGIPVKARDGKVHSVGLRPLLPDETS